MSDSRIPAFYKLTVAERLRMLTERSYLSDAEQRAVASGAAVLRVDQADKMIENVIGVFGLPMGLGLNFLVNDKPYVVPLVVEEPSIVAATSSAAKLVREAGGFVVETTDPILIGQIQVVGVGNTARAQAAVLQNKGEILNLANMLHPRMVARGGGARDVEVHVHPHSCARGDMLVVHLLVDTRDAMGANLVNSMCEGVASLVEKLTGGKVFLRILSNLTDRAIVTARCSIPTRLLAGKGYTGEQVRDGIILANDFAAADPYRAATHNKGIMNGIDPVAIATGNDWRAIEAAAHAYAARSGKYTSLTKWYRGDGGELIGELEMPMKVGTVGGPLEANPAVRIAHRILGVQSAVELAGVMGAVGLAQNFAAIRALSTEGIQRGHMTLHARTVANAAGTPAELFDAVVEELIESGEIKVWKAKEIVLAMRANAPGTGGALELDERLKESLSSGHGKIILLGEHAVVYGSHALAAAVPLAIQAKVVDAERDVHVMVPRWGIETTLQRGVDHKHSLLTSLDLILARLGLTERGMLIEIFPHVPKAMGLGGSAALAVAVIRALARHFQLTLTDEAVNEIAFECETVAHGTASGIDNTMATFGGFLLYKKGAPPLMRAVKPAQPLPIVIGMTGVESLTAGTVSRVKAAWQRNPALYERIFTEIDGLTLQGVQAIEAGNLELLGELMNVNQGLLNALGVSSRELEELIDIARQHGALGAKLTGGGGGGSMIALCPKGRTDEVAEAMRRSGYKAIVTQVG